jgi:hypothetical protein
MKKVLLPLLLLAALFTPACVTTPGGKLEPDTERIARIMGRAAYYGTVFYLTDHPQARPDFVIAAAALQTMENTTNWDYVAFSDALAALPIRQLQGDQGTIYIQLGLDVWDEALQLSTPILKSKLVAATVPRVRDGIQRALATRSVPPPRAADYPTLKSPAARR